MSQPFQCKQLSVEFPDSFIPLQLPVSSHSWDVDRQYFVPSICYKSSEQDSSSSTSHTRQWNTWISGTLIQPIYGLRGSMPQILPLFSAATFTQCNWEERGTLNGIKLQDGKSIMQDNNQFWLVWGEFGILFLNYGNHYDKNLLNRDFSQFLETKLNPKQVFQIGSLPQSHDL